MKSVLYRRARVALCRRWVNPHPERFHWLPPLTRWLYRRRGRPAATLARILEKLLMPDRLYETVTDSTGLRLRLRLGDAIQAQIFYGGYSEPAVMARFAACVRPHSLVVDAGAHCGQYALCASRAAPGVQVYAIEPDAANAADLRANLAANDIRNVTILQMAVAEQPGRLPLYRDDEQFGFVNHSLARGDGVFAGPAEEVEVATLDALLAGRTLPVSVMKLDIEGAELPALRGTQGVLRRDRPALFLEVDARWAANFGYAPADVWAYLTDLGYACAWLDDAGQEHPITAATPAGGHNWVALPLPIP